MNTTTHAGNGDREGTKSVMDWVISSQAAKELVEGSTTRAWSPERTVKPHEYAAIKKCRTCKAEKPLTEFYARYATCKACTLEKQRPRSNAYYAANRDDQIVTKGAYYEQNRERYTAWRMANKAANPEREKSVRLARRAAKIDSFREREVVYSSVRRAYKLRAMPAWADIEAIRLVYLAAQRKTRLTGIQYHVDHIVPLKGKTVCGLHCESNLRVIKASENVRKSNSLVEDIVWTRRESVGGEDKEPCPPENGSVGTSYSESNREGTIDKLSAPNTGNAVVDGSDASGNNTVVGARVGNHCQISTKIVRVSTRAQNSDVIGRSDELSYQVMRRQQELRRDVEAIALTNQASVADDGNTTPGKSGGLGAWLTTSTDRGATGANGGFANGIVAAPAVGAKRALSETTVRDIVQGVYEQGGDPSVMMSGPGVIRKFSEYLFTVSARIATLTSDQGKSAERATALGSVNVFVTDFGTLELVDNRLQQKYAADDGDCYNVYIIDPAYLSLAYLHGYRTEPLAKTGLADNRQMAVDWTLVVNNEAAHGVIADIDPTLAAVA